MKIGLFFSLAVSLLSLHVKEATNIESGENLKRIYIFFSDLAISDTLFNVTGVFYSVDGKKHESDGVCLYTNSIATQKLDTRLWYLDIPQNSKTGNFYIRDKENELWSSTDLFSISGCVFEYSTSNYSKINDNSGWHNISLTMDQFADYFLSRIDTNSSTFTNGFMSYKSLNDSFFVSLSDYEASKESSIRWNDTFLDRNTTFKEKWELTKTSYIANYKPEERVIWPYILGGCLVLLTVYSAYSIVIKDIVKRKKREK